MTFAPRAEDAGRTLLSTYSSRDETKTMRCTPSDKQVCNSSCVYLLHRDKKRRTVFPAGCSSIPTLTAAGAVTAINYFLSSCPLVSTLPHHPCTQILQRSTSSFRDGISGGGTTTKVLAGETLGTAPLCRCMQRFLTNSSVCPDSPASTVLALRQSASHDAASLALSPAPCLALLSFLEEADIRLSGAQRWFRHHL